MVDNGGKGREVSVSASVYLPQEIIIEEILTRLPAPIVVRFKRVCKLWRCSISSQRFVRIHFNRRRSSPPGTLTLEFPGSICPIFRTDDGGFRPWECLLRPANTPSSRCHWAETDAMHSCDGLILVKAFQHSRYAYFVCNPVISYTFRLPTPPQGLWKAFLFLDDVVNRYKIVGCVYGDTHVVHLFDFVGLSWKTFTFPEDINFFKNPPTPVALKGCLYWHSQNGGVISLNMTSGDTRVIKSPHNGRFRLMAIDENLYGVLRNKERGRYCYIIWILLHNLEWTFFHSGWYNNWDSSVCPQNAAMVVDQIKLLRVPHNTCSYSSVIPHMNTLLSVEVEI